MISYTDHEYYEKNKEKIKNQSKINSGGKGVNYLRLKAKKNCRTAANHVCQICGGEGIDAHHIIPVSEGGSDEKDNLICLCRSCHQKIHKGTLFIKYENNKLIVEEKPTEKTIKRMEAIARAERCRNLDFSGNTEADIYHERAYYRRKLKEFNNVFKLIDSSLWHTCAKAIKEYKSIDINDLRNLFESYEKKYQLAQESLKYKNQILNLGE